MAKGDLVHVSMDIGAVVDERYDHQFSSGF
jgi:hypothetical protein